MSKGWDILDVEGGKRTKRRINRKKKKTRRKRMTKKKIKGQRKKGITRKDKCSPKEAKFLELWVNGQEKFNAYNNAGFKAKNTKVASAAVCRLLKKEDTR